MKLNIREAASPYVSSVRDVRDGKDGVVPLIEITAKGQNESQAMHENLCVQCELPKLFDFACAGMLGDMLGIISQASGGEPSPETVTRNIGKSLCVEIVV